MESKSSHEITSDHYESKAHTDPPAIFAYARADLLAIRARWVTAQLVKWRERQDSANLRRFSRAYAGARGIRTGKNQLETISVDQAAYKALVRSRLRGVTMEEAFQRAKLPPGVGERNGRLVWQEYNRAVGRYWGIPSGTGFAKVPWRRVFVRDPDQEPESGSELRHSCTGTG